NRVAHWANRNVGLRSGGAAFARRNQHTGERPAVTADNVLRAVHATRDIVDELVQYSAAVGILSALHRVPPGHRNRRAPSSCSINEYAGTFQAVAMKVIILGGDGFCGWPTSLHLSARGYDVSIVDNLSRRNIDSELAASSLTPIRPIGERLRAWRELT